IDELVQVFLHIYLLMEARGVFGSRRRSSWHGWFPHNGFGIMFRYHMYDIYILSHNTVIITKLLLLDSCGKVRGEVHKNDQWDVRSDDSQEEGRRESPCSK